MINSIDDINNILNKNYKDIKELDWFELDNIVAYYKISEELIDTYPERFNWFTVSKRQKLNEEFIIKHSDRVVWDLISQYQKLSPEFIERFKDKLNTNGLKINMNILTKNEKIEYLKKNKFECFDNYFLAYIIYLVGFDPLQIELYKRYREEHDMFYEISIYNYSNTLFNSKIEMVKVDYDNLINCFAISDYKPILTINKGKRIWGNF